MQMFKILVLVLVMGLSLQAAEKKVVINLTSGDTHVISSGLIDSLQSMSEYYHKQGDTLLAVVVISGEAYGYFIEDIGHSPYKDKMKYDKKIASGLEALHDRYKVVFKMCQAGMKKRKIDPKTLYGYVEHDRNKNIYLIDYQNDGYAYLEVR